MTSRPPGLRTRRVSSKICDAASLGTSWKRIVAQARSKCSSANRVSSPVGLAVIDRDPFLSGPNASEPEEWG